MKDLRESPQVTLSIVSHRQGALIKNLLDDLSKGLDVSFEIILTLNLPEDETFLTSYSHLPIKVIRNTAAKGFGANHNAAFKQAEGAYFAVVNPDIRSSKFELQPLIEILASPANGVCGPAVYSREGELEDSARRFPTVWTFVKRKFFKETGSDYVINDQPVSVDWLGGMFLLFKCETYSRISGFDERYFMYLEDTDICLRLQNLGLKVVLEPKSKVIHDAQRASRTSWRHLRWHLASAWRFLFFSPARPENPRFEFETNFAKLD